ncbi:MAG: hypothetical protein ACRD15_17570 [Vicinamibacterales bacterium]
MAVASLACGVAVSLLFGANARGAVLLGMVGPFAVAASTWLIVQKTHQHTPERVSGLLIKLFAAKMVVFGAYVAAAVMLLPAERVVAFVVSFTLQYVLLHVMAAFHLRRVFSGETRALGVR